MVVEDAFVIWVVEVFIAVLIGLLFHPFFDRCFGDTANKAAILLVVLDKLTVITQLCERVDHDTAHDVAEKQLHDHDVQQVGEVAT